LFIAIQWLIYQRRTHIATGSNIHVVLIGKSVKSSHIATGSNIHVALIGKSVKSSHIATGSNIHVALIGKSVKSSHIHKETFEEFNKSLQDDWLID
jgi:hypothetical protein